MSEVAHLERMQEADRLSINLGEALERLVNNRDFRALILEKYLVEEAASMAETAGDPALSVEQRNDAAQMAQAPGHLKRYLRVMDQRAQHARNRAQSLADEIVAARLEESEQ